MPQTRAQECCAGVAPRTTKPQIHSNLFRVKIDYLILGFEKSDFPSCHGTHPTRHHTHPRTTKPQIHSNLFWVKIDYLIIGFEKSDFPSCHGTHPTLLIQRQASMISTTCPNHETNLLQVNDGQMSYHTKEASAALLDMYREELCNTREAVDTLLQLHHQETTNDTLQVPCQETNDDASTGGLSLFNEAEWGDQDVAKAAELDDGMYITAEQLTAIGELDDDIDFGGLGGDDVVLPAVPVRSDAPPQKAKRARGNPSKDGARMGKGVRKDVQARIDRLARGFSEMEAHGVVSLVRSTNVRCVFGWNTMTVLDGKQVEFADRLDEYLQQDPWLSRVTSRSNRTKALYQFIYDKDKDWRVIRHGVSVELGPEDDGLTKAQRKAKKFSSGYLVGATSFTMA